MIFKKRLLTFLLFISYLLASNIDVVNFFYFYNNPDNLLNNINAIYLMIFLSICLIIIIAWNNKKNNLYLRYNMFDGVIFLLFVLIIIRDYLQIRSLNSLFGLNLALLLAYLLTITIDRMNNGIKINKIILMCFYFSVFVQLNIVFLQTYDLLPKTHQSYLETGTFENSGPLGIFLASSIPGLILILILIFKNRIIFLKKSLLIFTGFSALLGVLYTVYRTNSRTAWVSAIAVVALIIIRNIKLSDKNHFLKHTAVKISALMSFAVLFSYFIVNIYTNKKPSADGRILIWKICYLMGKDNILYGFGNNAVVRNYLEYQSIYFSKHNFDENEVKVAGKIKYAFNDYIEIILNYGVLAFVLFGIIIYFIVKFFLKNNLGINTCINSIIISLLLSSMSSYPLQILSIKLMFLLLSASISSTMNKKFYSFNLSNKVVIIILFILFIHTYHLFNKINLIRNAYNRLILVEENNSSDIKYKMYECEILYSELLNDTDFLTIYAKLLAMNKKFDRSNSVLKQAAKIEKDPFIYINIGKNYQTMGFYKLAEVNFTYAMTMIPNRFYPKYLLVKLYLLEGKKNRANFLAKEIVEMDEKISSPATRDIKDEMKDLLKQ